jgi:hypothetical protein
MDHASHLVALVAAAATLVVVVPAVVPAAALILAAALVLPVAAVSLACAARMSKRETGRCSLTSGCSSLKSMHKPWYTNSQ